MGVKQSKSNPPNPTEPTKTNMKFVNRLSSSRNSTSKSNDKVKRVTPPAVQKAINTIRVLSADQVQASKSGHPGAPMGCAPMGYVLFKKIMKYNPKNPEWMSRDRFVLSNGHSCALLYSLLHLTGYERPTMDDLRNFRQLDSVTAGHPENFLLSGVEVSTGPLGQGISNAVGMAMAERQLGATYNKPGMPVIDNFTFVICGDGCLQEGVSSESSSLAGHHKLGKLIVLYDDNNITIDGSTNLSFTEDVPMRYRAYGWHVLEVEDGDSNPAAIEAAVREAKTVLDKPTLIKVTTTIGFGSAKQGTAGVHGAPLGDDDLGNVKQQFGFEPSESFVVEGDVREHFKSCVEDGVAAEASWQKMYDSYKTTFPELASELERRMSGKLPADWDAKLPSWTKSDKGLASRDSSQSVLEACAAALPELLGGSADLTPSNKTNIKSWHDFQHDTPDGRYLRFGVREHGMSAICNGMCAYGGMLPYCATFLNFAGYALGAIRLSALSRFRVLYVMTHDSIGLGEDGPTHQPVEMLISLRSMPNIMVFRPADGNEVSGAYKQAIEHTATPSLFALSRSGLPNLPGSSAASVAKGAYTVQAASGTPAVIIVGTGSEVQLCVAAAEILASSGVLASVVSMPCWELYDEQSKEYKQSVFPEGVPVLGVEAAAKTGWEKYTHFQIGMARFGKSAPADKLYDLFGFTGEKIAAKAEALVKHYSGKAVPWLVDAPML